MFEISKNSYLTLLKLSGVSSFMQDNPNNLYEKKENVNIPSEDRSISGVKNIEDLKIFVNNSIDCNLKKNAKKTVICDGNEKAKIMLIGEAPGAEEDKIGKPFVGAAGQLLNKMLDAISLNRNKVYITNVIPWRPPNNRAPTNEEILKCLPFIQKHIELINPKIIVLLGSTASKAILTTNLSISKLRGSWHEYKSINLKNKIKCLVTYHPAFLLRSPNYKKKSWEDLKMIEKKIVDENI